jgi:hypothetical protein
MASTHTKTLEFLEVKFSEDEIKKMLISTASRDNQTDIEPDGVTDVKKDGYGGYVVLLQKKPPLTGGSNK